MSVGGVGDTLDYVESFEDEFQRALQFRPW